MADGDLTLNDNPNVDTGYVESGGKLHQVHLTRQLNGTLELNDDNYNVDTGYVTVNGKKHRVHLVADLSNGGSGSGVSSVNGQTGVVVLTGADLTTLVTVSTTTLTQELASDTIYDCGELTNLTITFPATMDAKYISQVNFTSGTTPTALTAPNTIKWKGEDLTGGVFVPVASKRYALLFFYDGTAVRGIVQSVAA